MHTKSVSPVQSSFLCICSDALNQMQATHYKVSEILEENIVQFTSKTPFKIHSHQVSSNTSVFSISIKWKFLSLGEVGRLKQKPGVSPHWKTMGTKSSFNRKMQRARGQQERTQLHKELSHGMWEEDLETTPWAWTVSPEHREHGSDRCRGSASGTPLSQKHPAARYSWLWQRLVNLQYPTI